MIGKDGEMKIDWKDFGVAIFLFLIVFIVIYLIISPKAYEASKIVPIFLMISYSAAMLYYFNRHPLCWSSWKENAKVSFFIGLSLVLILFFLIILSDLDSWYLRYYPKVLRCSWGTCIELERTFDVSFLIADIGMFVGIITATVLWGIALSFFRRAFFSIFRKDRKALDKTKQL